MAHPFDLFWIYVGALVASVGIAVAAELVRRRSAAGQPVRGFAVGAAGPGLRGPGVAALAMATPVPVTQPTTTGTPADPQSSAPPSPQGHATSALSAPEPAAQETPSRVLGEMSKAPPAGPAAGAPERARRNVRIARDNEFLPAALEILETPPSPAATALMLGICAVFVAALLWAFVGRLDIHAVAQGKIQPSGRTRVVQPLEPGRVAAIHVRSGDTVAEGDILVELDPTEQAADLEALSREFDATSAEAARRRAAVAAARLPEMQPEPIAFAPGTAASLQAREASLLDAELAQLRSVVDGLRSQVAERRATQQRLMASIEARSRVLDLSRERVGMREEILTRGAGSRALIIDAQLQYETTAMQDASERGQLAEADAQIQSLERRMIQVRDQFIAEQTQKGADAERRRDRLEQEIVKARSKRDRTLLRAPGAGVVQQIEATTLGQVVTGGQTLMSVVPTDAPLEVEALIANKDIGFVRPGQTATVKVEAFPFTRYGSIDAVVERVSLDAVEDRNTTAMMDAASAARPQGTNASRASPGQSLVYPAILRLSRRTILVDGKEIPLSPGMAVTVEVKTGDRRALSYILSPLRELFAESVNER